jgi:hypothetical protein
MESIRLQAVDLAEKLPIIKQFVGDDKNQSTAPIGSATASIDETAVIDVEPKEKEQAG